MNNPKCPYCGYKSHKAKTYRRQTDKALVTVYKCQSIDCGRGFLGES